MNPNRQNNRCVTPAGPGFGGRQGGRFAGQNCGPVGVFPVPATGCAEAVSVGNDCCDPCASGISGGIIIGQGNAGCNMETMLNGMPIAMAYVPWQSYGNVYSQQVALRQGTLFQELDLDFAGRRCN